MNELREIERALFAVLGEASHTFSEARELIAPLNERFGFEVVNQALDFYYFVGLNELTGEKFIALRVDFSIIDGDIEND